MPYRDQGHVLLHPTPGARPPGLRPRASGQLPVATECRRGPRGSDVPSASWAEDRQGPCRLGPPHRPTRSQRPTPPPSHDRPHREEIPSVDRAARMARGKDQAPLRVSSLGAVSFTKRDVVASPRRGPSGDCLTFSVPLPPRAWCCCLDSCTQVYCQARRGLVSFRASDVFRK